MFEMWRLSHLCDLPPNPSINHEAIQLTYCDRFCLLLFILVLKPSSLCNSWVESLVTFQMWISEFLTYFFILFPSFSPASPFFSVSSSCLHVWSSGHLWTMTLPCTHIPFSVCAFYYVFSLLVTPNWLSLKKTLDVYQYCWWTPQLPLAANVWHTVWQLSCPHFWLCSGSHKLISFKEKEDGLSILKSLGPDSCFLCLLFTIGQPPTRLEGENEDSRHWFHVITGCSVLASFSNLRFWVMLIFCFHLFSWCIWIYLGGGE